MGCMPARWWTPVLLAAVLAALVGWQLSIAEPEIGPSDNADAHPQSSRGPEARMEVVAPVQRAEAAAESDDSPAPAAQVDQDSDRMAEAAKGFPSVFEAAIERLRVAFPGMALPESRQPGQREAAEFVAAYLQVVGEDAAAREVYQNELVDQITTETLAQWERVLPPGTDVTALRDAVLAGKHETIRLPPGGHFVTMSGSYMIVPAGHSRSLDWYGLASQATTKEADMRLLVLVNGLR